MIHFIMHWLGLDNASGSQYLFWSGIFGDLTIFGAVIFYLKHQNCHIKGCPRLGRYPFQHFKLCAHHHPQVPKKLTPLHIVKAHLDSLKQKADTKNTKVK